MTPGRLELRCQALLFDLDGVLVDSRVVVERTWRRWAERHHMDPVALLQIAHGRRTRDTLQVAAPQLATDAEVAWLDSTELHDREGLTEVPGAKALLTVLPADRWAIVTSCGRDLAAARLASAGLPLPEVLVTSEAVEHGKPAPEGYLRGAERLGHDPATCLVLEDAPAGVAAGQAAGARVLGLTTSYTAKELPGVVATIPDLRGINIRTTESGLAVTISTPT